VPSITPRPLLLRVRPRPPSLAGAPFPNGGLGSDNGVVPGGGASLLSSVSGSFPCHSPNPWSITVGLHDPPTPTADALPKTRPRRSSAKGKGKGKGKSPGTTKRRASSKEREEDEPDPEVVDMSGSVWDILIDVESDVPLGGGCFAGCDTVIPFDVPNPIPADYGLAECLARLSPRERAMYMRDIHVTPEQRRMRRRQIQGSPEWETQRQCGIGASESAYWMGIHPWQTFASALRSKIERERYKASRVAARGTHSEPVGREKVRHAHAKRIADQVDRVMRRHVASHPGYPERLIAAVEGASASHPRTESKSEARPIHDEFTMCVRPASFPPLPDDEDFGLVSIASLTSRGRGPTVKWYGFKVPIPAWVQYRWLTRATLDDDPGSYLPDGDLSEQENESGKPPDTGAFQDMVTLEPPKGSMPDLDYPYLTASSDRGLVLFRMYLACGLEIKFGGRDEPYVFGKPEHYIQMQQTSRVHRYPMMLYCPCSSRQFQSIPIWNDRPFQDALYYVLTQRFFRYFFPCHVEYQDAVSSAASAAPLLSVEPPKPPTTGLATTAFSVASTTFRYSHDKRSAKDRLMLTVLARWRSSHAFYRRFPRVLSDVPLSHVGVGASS
jgi:hypothetical protein